MLGTLEEVELKLSYSQEKSELGVLKLLRKSGFNYFVSDQKYICYKRVGAVECISSQLA